MPKRILITEPIIPSVIKNLEKEFSVDVGKRNRFNTEEALIEVITQYDALLPMLSNPVTKKVMAAADKLKIVANHAVGYNNIDLKAAHNQNIYVANTPDVLTDSCAEFTMALMLTVARRICEAQDYLLTGKFDGWDPLGFLGMELQGSTLGIVGMGRIGQAVAHRAKSFGMNLIYHNRNRVDPDIEEELETTYCSTISELAQKADVLSLHCPLTDETKHLVNKKVLSEMGDHSILLNTSRGPVVDEAALADALHNNTIGGAGLDVFEDEPMLHLKLKDAPNCILTPHMASASYQTREAIGMLAANAITGILKGNAPSEIPNLIQP